MRWKTFPLLFFSVLLSALSDFSIFVGVHQRSVSLGKLLQGVGAEFNPLPRQDAWLRWMKFFVRSLCLSRFL